MTFTIFGYEVSIKNLHFNKAFMKKRLIKFLRKELKKPDSHMGISFTQYGVTALKIACIKQARTLGGVTVDPSSSSCMNYNLGLKEAKELVEELFGYNMEELEKYLPKKIEGATK